MSDKGLFLHNVIALIWDFDRTLSPHYMQRPLFAAYGVDEAAFWDEVNKLPDYYARKGMRVQRDTCYLGHLLSYVREGRMPGLSNAKLRELGASIELFPGLPSLFGELKTILDVPEFREGDLRLEHYVVSTGLYEMIKGSAISGAVDGIWASSFIEEPAGPGTDLSGAPRDGVITQIAEILDNTTKTRALFEINKGVNKGAGISVNDAIAEEDRRVPFSHMIYIADGPSDIPCFSVVKTSGGLTYAVHSPGSEEQLAQADALREADRVHHYGPADFEQGSQTVMWLELQVKKMAQGIMERRRTTLNRKVERQPVHLSDEE